MLYHSHVMVGSSTVTRLDTKYPKVYVVNVVFYTVGWWDLLYSDTSRCTGHVVSNMCSNLGW